MFTIVWQFGTWCDLSANLECRSEMHCTRLAANTGRKKVASAKLCGVEQRAPPIFGRATIRLDIGPHFSGLYYGRPYIVMGRPLYSATVVSYGRRM